MLHFEREVKDIELIKAMLDLMDHVTLSMFDEDGYPYAIPVNFGYEVVEDQLKVYMHCAKRGHKIDLLKKNPNVCLTFSLFNDFYDGSYKKHHHDYRSVVAKGKMRLVTYDDDPQAFHRGYDLLYLCNHHTLKPLEDRPAIPAIYIGEITCDLKNVTAKAEFPIRCVEDVPFMDVASKEPDDTPFDISDIIAARKAGK